MKLFLAAIVVLSGLIASTDLAAVPTPTPTIVPMTDSATDLPSDEIRQLRDEELEEVYAPAATEITIVDLTKLRKQSQEQYRRWQRSPKTYQQQPYVQPPVIMRP